MIPPQSASGAFKAITSLTNPIVKDLRALAMKKHRDETGQFLGEGLKLVTDALQENWPVKAMCFAAASLANKAVQDAAAKVKARGGQVLEVSEEILSKITRRENPQMVVGVFAQKLAALEFIVPKNDEIYVVLEQVRDPGNLGTIMRTVDSVGAKGVILIGEVCDPFSVEAVRATMGSLFHVPVTRCSLENFLNWKASTGIRCVGTHLKATHDYRHVEQAVPTALVMGNEQQGLSDALASACDALVKIPMRGQADSLNLAIATGVMLYELTRTRS